MTAPKEGTGEKKVAFVPPVHADVSSNLGLPNFGGGANGGGEETENKKPAQVDPKSDAVADNLSKLPSLPPQNLTNGKILEHSYSTFSYLRTVSGKSREQILKNAIDWPIIIPCSAFIIVTWILARLNLPLLLTCPWIILAFWLFINSRLDRFKLVTENDLKRSMLHDNPFPDEETANWLNLFMEKVWPMFVERIVSVKVIPKLLPWFLNEYKPPGLSSLQVNGGFLGKIPPFLIKNVQVFRNSSTSEHVILKMGVEVVFSKDSFLEFVAHVGPEFIGLGFIPWKAFVTDVILIGDARLSLKLKNTFPFVEDVKFSFFSPPQLSLSIKIFGKKKMQSLDASSMPLVSSFIETTLQNALKSSLVHPNALVIDDPLSFINDIIEIPKVKDVKKEETEQPEDDLTCSSVCLVEIIKAEKLIVSDMNGSSDPYIKGQIGMAKFKTSIKHHTLNPTWDEEFLVPIPSWTDQTFLHIYARDHDKFNTDDDLGHCKVDLQDYNDGERHELWVDLEGVNSGRLLISITISEDELEKGEPAKSGDDVGQPTRLDAMRQKSMSMKKAEFMKQGRSATMTRRSVQVGTTFHRIMPGVQVFTWAE